MFRLACALFIAAALAAPAQAQVLCGKRADVIKQLSGMYKEAPSAMGLASNGGVVEVLTAPQGATWTIILTKPDGTSCLMAAGENWEGVEQLAQGPGI